MYKSGAFVALGLTLVLYAGCSSDPDNTTTSSSSSSSSGSSSSSSGSSAICTMPAAPIPCEDDVVQQMNFKNNVAPGVISDAPDGNGFLSTIDARAGGVTPTDSYVYAKFTDKGLQKVDLTDEESITSMDWDISFRRFVIRINSGNSGPSCVTTARLEKTMYDELMASPADANYIPDEYFSAACALIPDGYGLGPGTAMHNFWDYPGSCVSMTNHVYVVQKADGQKVKLTVADYYEPMSQEQCDTTGAVPMGTPGAMIRMRWAFLP